MLEGRSDLITRDKWLPFYNRKRMEDAWLLTNRSGDWEVLSDEEFKEINSIFTSLSLIERLSEKGLVIYNNNVSDLLTRWEIFNHGFYEGPYLHIVHLTQRCNLGCGYCHSSTVPLDAPNRDLPTETAIEIARFISTTPSTRINVNFQGGEPTLMLSTMETIASHLVESSHILEKKMSFSITTNGTLITPELLNFFKKYKVHVTVSLDGPEDIHNNQRSYRDGKGSYSDAIAAKQKVANTEGVQGSGSILVLTKSNIDKVFEIIDEYVKQGQSVIHLKPMTKLGRARLKWDENSMSFEEYWKAYESSIEYMSLLLRHGIFICEMNLLIALDKVLTGRNTTYVDTRNPCGLVYGVLNYDIDGRIYACHEGKRTGEFLLGSVKSDTMQAILSSQRAMDIASSSVVDQHPECSSCAYLAYCSPCPAHNYQSSGSREIKPYEDFHCLFTIKLYDYIFDKLKSDPEEMTVWWKYHKVKDMITV